MKSCRCHIIILMVLALVACTTQSPVAVDCPEIGSGCKLEGLTISTSHPPQVMQPFGLVLQWDGSEAAGIGEVYASFAMEGMEMSLNRYRLMKNADGLWRAEITLPLCVRGRADWLMQIDARTRFGSRQYLLRFYTD